jgi:hypothetical protein
MHGNTKIKHYTHFHLLVTLCELKNDWKFEKRVLCKIFLYRSEKSQGLKVDCVVIAFCSKLSTVAQQLRSCLGRLTAEVYRSHKIMHRHTTGRPIWTGGQPVEEAATFTTCNKHKKRTSMPSTGFELEIPIIEQPQKYVCSANGGGPIIVSRVT